MKSSVTSAPLSAESTGMAYGFVGVFCFSLTLPATRAAVAELDPTIVGLGRALIAAVLAAGLLFALCSPFPTRSQAASLFIIALGVVVGFPLFSAWAVHRVPAAHGAIILGILSLATAMGGAIRVGERPSVAFWLASVAGSILVVVFALLPDRARTRCSCTERQNPSVLIMQGAVSAATQSNRMLRNVSATLNTRVVPFLP